MTGAKVGLHATPIVARNVVIVGAAFETGANPKSRSNVKGAVRGYDVRTGKRLWLFRTIPQPGEVRQRHVGEGLVGATPAIPACGRRFPWTRSWGWRICPWSSRPTTTTAASGPGTRCSARASSPSICRPASANGTTSWCTTGSGTWISRARRFWPTSPSTAGRSRRSRSRPSRRFLYVFDRVTGQPIWPIEERPVPKGDVPGERYSPTQPFPTKPPAYDRQGLSIDDLIDFTPELRAEAVKVDCPLHASGRSSRRRWSAKPRDRSRRWRWRRRAPRPTGPAARTIPRRTSCTCIRRAPSPPSGSSRRLRGSTCGITRATC